MEFLLKEKRGVAKTKPKGKHLSLSKPQSGKEMNCVTLNIIHDNPKVIRADVTYPPSTSPCTITGCSRNSEKLTHTHFTSFSLEHVPSVKEYDEKNRSNKSDPLQESSA